MQKPVNRERDGAAEAHHKQPHFHGHGYRLFYFVYYTNFFEKKNNMPQLVCCNRRQVHDGVYFYFLAMYDYQ